MMSKTCASRVNLFRRSRVYLLLAASYTSIVNTTALSMFHPILPFYLRHILATNCTDDVTIASSDVINATSCYNDTWLNNEVSRQIGVIGGSGSIMMVLSSFVFAFLVQRFSLRVNHYISFSVVALSPILACFANDVITMCFAVGCACGGQPYSFICYATQFSEYAENDKQLTKLHGAWRISVIVGFIVGYSGASASYQFLGHKATFGIGLALLVPDFFVRTGLIMAKVKEAVLQEEAKETNEQMLNPEDAPIEKTTENSPSDTSRSFSKQLGLLTNPFIILNSVNACVLYIGTSIFWGTAPNFVATEFGAEQSQTGAMMAVGAGIDLVVQLIAAATVNTQSRRIAVMVLANLALGAGYFSYPFVGTVWAALAPETIVRSGKDLVYLMITTMYPYICDGIGVSDKRFVYAIATISPGIGVVVGYYISGVLVVAVGFKYLYIGLGTTSIIASLVSIAFIDLKPSEPGMSDPDEKICLSVADLRPPDLGIADLTASMASIRGPLDTHHSNPSSNGNMFSTPNLTRKGSMPPESLRLSLPSFPPTSPRL